MRRSWKLRGGGAGARGLVRLVPAALLLSFLCLFFVPQAAAAGGERFLKVKAPKAVRHGVPWIRVKTTQRPTSFSARLNGRDVTAALLRLDGATRTATLSPSEGLRRGRNRLTIVAGHDGVVDRDRVVIRMRSRVLPAAGRNRRVAPDKRLRLDATGSLPARGGKLAYRWRIVDKPKGSKARLRRSRTAHPRLITDRRGIYRLDLRVRRPGAAGAKASARRKPRKLVAAGDKLEIVATKTPPIGLPISTLEQKNGVYGVSVAGTFYESKDPNNSTVQLLHFSQKTMELEQNEILPLALPVPEMREILCGLEGIVVIQVPPPAAEAFVDQYGEELACMPPPTETAFPAGISWIRAGDNTLNWSGPMQGYLQYNEVATNAPKNQTPVISWWYRFVPGQYVSYETQAPNPPANGNTIRISGVNPTVDITDTQQLPAGASGFHGLALDAQSLKVLDSAAFATNGGSNEAQGVTELAEWLKKYEGEPGTRVILQSIGSPQANASPSGGTWAEAAQAVDALGGNSHIFNTINGSYALYGGAGMGPDSFADGVDLSSSATGKPASLGGVLSRDPLYEFSPRLVDPGGDLDTRLWSIAFQPVQQWPHPDETAGEQAAAKWIMENRLADTKLPSVEALREKYWSDGTFVRDLAHYSGELDCPNVPAISLEFSREDFKQVCEELNDEMGWVETVATLLGPPANDEYGELQKVLVGVGTTEIDEDIRTKMVEQLANYDPGDSALVAEVFGFISDLTWVGEEAFPADGISAFGMVAAVTGLSSDFASATGGGAADGALQEKADQVATEFLNNTATTALQFSHLTEIIVSDYGKLKEVGELAGPSGPWAWEREDAGLATNAFTSGAVRWAYRQLLPAKYSAEVLLPNAEAGDDPNTPPREYRCISLANENRVEYPLAFPNAPEQSYYDHYAAPESPDAYRIMLDSDRDPPSAALAEALQAPPIQLYLPWLFEELPLRNYDPNDC